jgi:ABC-type dipeptide/oligopeptide/nickel transport system ATPase component
LNQEYYLSNLKENWQKLERAFHYLDKTYQKCTRLTPADSLTDEALDLIEILTSRFARVTDLLMQKIFRSLDKVEFETEGTLLDILNRAHKRNFFDSIEDMRALKDLRNEIAHEYASENISVIFQEVMTYIPLLFKIKNNIQNYLQKKFLI